MISQEVIDSKEEEIRERVSRLSNDDKKVFYFLVNKKIKDPDTYAVLNWLFIAGLHHFYLHKFMRGFINLSLSGISLIGITMSLKNDSWSSFLIFLGLGVLLFFIELPQLFASQKIVQEYNNTVMEEALLQL